MLNPYQLDPRVLRAITKQAQEQQLITLRDDSSRPPPTLGTPIWQSSLFGPWLGQPASRFVTFEHGPMALQGTVRVMLGLGALIGALALLRLVFR